MRFRNTSSLKGNYKYFFTPSPILARSSPAFVSTSTISPFRITGFFASQLAAVSRFYFILPFISYKAITKPPYIEGGRRLFQRRQPRQNQMTVEAVPQLKTRTSRSVCSKSFTLPLLPIALISVASIFLATSVLVAVKAAFTP
mgnify:CR=1 FL=1